jgi:hypothetical protein
LNKAAAPKPYRIVQQERRAFRSIFIGETMFLRIGTSAAVAALLGGCGANFNAAFHRFDTTQHESISIDAKQRVVVTGYRAAWRNKDEDGEVTEEVDAQPVTCAEPSPDALSVLSATFGAGAQDDTAKLALKLAGGQNEAGKSIGLRTQTIQILRDAMYRLCEGYQAGALSALGFERLQRRYQNAMLGLLAVEQLTGAVTPKDDVVVKADQGQGVDVGAVKPAGDKPADPKTGSASTGASTPTDPKDAKPKAETPKKEEPKTPQAKPQISDAVGIKVASTVEEIVKSVLTVDYTKETCLNFLIDDGGKRKDSDVIDFCKVLLGIPAGAVIKFRQEQEQRNK